MSIPQPFPEDYLEDIRSFDGNNKCCDCPSLDTDWASVSHGTLICLDCAGKHRSLGVHVSFVRSITMDTWSQQQVEMMKQGGNAQIRRFFKRLEIENSPLQTLYCTKAAEHYREKLKERVDKVLSGEIMSEKRSRSEKSKLPQSPASPPLPSPPPTKSITANIITARFNTGPMGMTLTKDFRDQAFVSKLVPGGNAQQQGIKVGDIVISVAGKTMGSYEEIMHMIPLMPRPLELSLTRVETSPSKTENIHHSKSDTALFSMKQDHQKVQSDSGTSALQVPVPGIRGTKALDLSQSENSTYSKAKPRTSANLSCHPMKQASKTVKLLRKGLKDVDLADGNEEDDSEQSDNNDIDEDNDEEANVDENEVDTPHDHVNHSQQSIGPNKMNTDISPSESSTSQESEKSKNPLEPGSMIKVLKPDSGKWKTAMIKRRHKDNTFKVIYKDGSEETHVPIFRLALAANVMSSANGKDHNPTSVQSVDSNKASLSKEDEVASYEDALHSSYETLNKKNESVVNTADFVVEPEENLDAWIADDFQNDFAHTSISKEDSHFATKEAVSSSSPAIAAHKDREAKSFTSGDLIVEFVAAPLGLTLSTNSQNEPEVIRLREGGNAAKEGVQVGDIVILINGMKVRDYEEAMQLIGAVAYPVTINFRRPAKGIVAESGDVIVRNSKMIATQLMDSMGFTKDSILTAGSKNNGRLANSKNSVSSGSISASPASSSTLQSAPRSRLGPNPGINQFDVQFDQEELGFRVQERIGAQIVTVVTDIAEKGEAKNKGVTIGCVIIGINFEPYLSHAHTVATLKYSKRPVVIRFSKP